MSNQIIWFFLKVLSPALFEERLCYPLMVLTNRSEMKRKAAVCMRSWSEWKQLEMLMHTKCHYRYQNAAKIQVAGKANYFASARSKAIEVRHDCCNIVT